VLPPEVPQGTGTGRPPAPEEGRHRPAAGEAGADDQTLAGEAGRAAGSDLAGALSDGNGAAHEPATVTLPPSAPGGTAAGHAGAGLAGDQVRGKRSLGGTARAVGRATLAAPAAAAAAVRRLRPGAPSSLPAVQAIKVRSGDIAGTVLARLTVLPAVLILAWLIPGVPLLLAGHFAPIPMILIAVALAAGMTVNGLRVVPASWPRPIAGGRQNEPGWTVWFGLLATVAVVAALTGWQLTESSQELIVLRGQGTYLQAGYWIAQHGSLPIPQSLTAFGAAHAGLHFSSTGFLARGTSIYPAVMPGLPLLLAGGFWLHGVSGALATGAILGGLAMLSFAGLVGRLAGPQWAPAGALILGLTLPQQYVGRTTLSETPLQILLFGGLCLLIDAVALRRVPPVPVSHAADAAEARSARARLAVAWQLGMPSRWTSRFTPQRVLAALAGLALSFGLVVSLDALVCLLVAIPFGGLLVTGRRPQAIPFLSGLGVGFGYGLLSLYLLDRPLLDTVGRPVALAGVVATWLLAATILASQVARISWVRGFVPRALRWRPVRRLPEAGAVVAVAVLIGFAVRPYVQTVRGHASPAAYTTIATLQRLQGLPVDPTRTYAEQTLYWAIWYIGLPTMLLGAFGLAIVVRNCLRALLAWRDPSGVWRIWGLPLAMICAGSVAVLWAPHIVPDQPWASRRLIVTVIPGLILFGLWATAWLTRHARDRGARPWTAAAVGLSCVAAMLVPTVATTFGVGLRHAGKSGALQPIAHGLALTRTGTGEVIAIQELCDWLPRNASVVIIDQPTALEFAQVIRGTCGVPVAWMADRPIGAVQDQIGSIAAAGRRPLLLAGSLRQLGPFGGAPVRILDLATAADPRDLTQLPTSLRPVRFQIWMTAPGSAGAGA
jgi:hypothetical protein